jgi:hypothetical protein
MESVNIDENFLPPLSYLEMGGIAFSGIVTGTFAALMACAPGAAPSYRGGTERLQGLALTGQAQLNQIVQNLFAFKNYKYPSIDMPLAGNYRNLDIAPQEAVNIIVAPEDTVRRLNIRNDFNVNSVSWDYNAEDSILLPRVSFKPIVNGNHYELIAIPDTPDAGGFDTPSVQVPNVPSMAFPASYGALFGAMAGGITDYLILEDTSAAKPPNFTELDSGGSGITNSGDEIVNISSAGLYLIFFHCSVTMPTTATDQTSTVTVNTGSPYYFTNYYNKNTTDATSQLQTLVTSVLWYMTAGSTITFGYSGGSVAGTHLVASVVRLS